MDDTPSDVAFALFLATVTEEDLNPYELRAFRHARFNALKESN